MSKRTNKIGFPKMNFLVLVLLALVQLVSCADEKAESLNMEVKYKVYESRQRQLLQMPLFMTEQDSADSPGIQEEFATIPPPSSPLPSVYASAFPPSATTANHPPPPPSPDATSPTTTTGGGQVVTLTLVDLGRSSQQIPFFIPTGSPQYTQEESCPSQEQLQQQCPVFNQTAQLYDQVMSLQQQAQSECSGLFSLREYYFSDNCCSTLEDFDLSLLQACACSSEFACSTSMQNLRAKGFVRILQEDCLISVLEGSPEC